MKFQGTPETERRIEKVVDKLLTCPKSREETLIRELRALWRKRLSEIGGRDGKQKQRDAAVADYEETASGGPSDDEGERGGIPLGGSDSGSCEAGGGTPAPGSQGYDGELSGSDHGLGGTPTEDGRDL